MSRSPSYWRSITQLLISCHTFISKTPVLILLPTVNFVLKRLDVESYLVVLSHTVSMAGLMVQMVVATKTFTLVNVQAVIFLKFKNKCTKKKIIITYTPTHPKPTAVNILEYLLLVCLFFFFCFCFRKIPLVKKKKNTGPL